MANQLINELGNRYGLLTVIGSTKDKNNKTVWVCQCDCGNIKILRGHDFYEKEIIKLVEKDAL